MENKQKLEPEDFYRDANGNTVFTAVFHLKRGFCCENGCRHCPYDFKNKSLASSQDNSQENIQDTHKKNKK